jgi:hypothetical protein
MKNSVRTRRTPSKLSESIHDHLNMYALAASATGVATLAGAQPAAAEIVYTPAHTVILTNHKISLDLNHDGIGDFMISNHAFCTTDICGRTLLARPLGANNEVAGMKGLIFTLYASAFNRGARIGPSADFSGKLMAASGTEYGSAGQWRNVTNRYLGLKFVAAGQVHFGWARFSVTSGTGKIIATLTGYAYETIPNRPITAGQTKGTNQVTGGPDAALGAPAPASATLGLLAQGAPGMSLWRRKEVTSEILSLNWRLERNFPDRRQLSHE